MRPQKPSREGGARGALPVAVPALLSAAWADCAAGWFGSDEVVCAKAGIASTAAKGRAITRRWFIMTSSKFGVRFRCTVATPSTFVACVKFWLRPLNRKESQQIRCAGPALTRRLAWDIRRSVIRRRLFLYMWDAKS